MFSRYGGLSKGLQRYRACRWQALCKACQAKNAEFIAHQGNTKTTSHSTVSDCTCVMQKKIVGMLSK